MAKWRFDGVSGRDYPGLGFQAAPGNILEADNAPDASWSSADAGETETVTRYNSTGVVPAFYTEPTDGAPLLWDDASNTYQPAATALSATYERKGLAPLVNVRNALAAGQGAAIQVLGDSTGNGADEWVYLMAQSLGTAYPTHNIHHRLWNDAAQAYDRPTIIQAGASGPESVTIQGATMRVWEGASGPMASGSDLDVRVHIKPSTWTPASNQSIAAQYGGAPQRAFRFLLDTSKRIRIYWSTDGTAEQPVAQSTTSVPFSDGTAGWCRFTLDADDGAGNHVISFYTSTDGVTWTPLGTPITRAGTTTVHKPTAAPLEFGGRTATVELMAGGIIYEAQARDGIDGGIINPPLPSQWTPHDSFTGARAGSPTLTVWNGSHGGAYVGYHDDATRRPKLVPKADQAVVFVSLSHNGGFTTSGSHYAMYEAWIANIVARLPRSAIVALTQNPRQSPAAYITEQATRRIEIGRMAAAKGWSLIDTYGAFLDDNRPLSDLIDTDGIHPKPAGSILWRDTVLAQFGGL